MVHHWLCSTHAVDGVISGTLGNQAAGTYSVTISATDGFNTGSTSFTWTVNDVTTPVVTNPGNQTNNEGAAVSLAISGSDSDGDPLTYSASNLPAGLSINSSSGVISGTLGNQAAGTYVVTVSATESCRVGSANPPEPPKP